MPRRYRKVYKKRDKYSVENTTFFSRLSYPTTSSLTIVPTTAVRGMRKVKHLTVSLCNINAAEDQLPAVVWALVYVPEGYTPQAFQNATSENPSVDLYAANQFVMSCGVVDFNAGPQRIRTPLARNLNSGDSIVLLLAPATSGTGFLDVRGVVSYAITLQ